MSKMWNYITDRKEKFIKGFVLFAISFLYLARAINGIEPYPTGDGPEYIVTTEAFCNHFTPDIRTGDVATFKESYCRKFKWTENYKYPFFDKVEEFVAFKGKKPMSTYYGIYTDSNDKNYGFHFFFYSLLNAPGRYLAELKHANPMRGFLVTNALFVIITCFFLLFYSPFNIERTILVALIFCFSSTYWYLGWIHPEIYTVCLVTLSLWFFFQNKQYLGLLLMAFAGLQNQPLMIMLAFMALKTIFDKGFNIKNILRIGLCSFIFLWPPLFYFIHFHTTNLIKDAGFLSSDYITFTRVFGFYFDFNQGVILVIPLVLLVYIFFFFRKWLMVLAKKETFDFSYFLPVFLIVMSCIVSTMGNWNHGQAVVNRYASWFSAIIIMHIVFIAGQIKNELGGRVLFHFMFLTQVFTILFNEQYNSNDWGQDRHKALAQWMLEEHPSLYNPDPQIFIERTNRNENVGPSASPVFFIKNSKEITKLAVYKDSLYGLENYGFSKSEIERLKPTLRYVNNWAYLNRGEFTCSKSGEEINSIVRNKKIKVFEEKIRSHPEWVQQIDAKAKTWGISTDEAIRKDASYLLTLQEEEERNR